MSIEAEKQEPLAWMSPSGQLYRTRWEAIENGEQMVTPLYTTPVHAIDISQERADETAKCVHEFECPRCGHCCKEWVGLTDQEIYDIREDHTYNDEEFNEFGFAKDIEAKLKEKNT